MALVNLKPSQKGVTVLIVIAAAIFFCCVLACLGAARTLNKAASELAAADKQVQEGNKIAQTERDSRNHYEDTRAQIRCLESSVSDQAYVPTLLKQLEYLGHSVDLKVIGVRPKAPDPAPVVKKTTDPSAGANSTAAAGTGTETAKEAPKPYDELQIELDMEGNYMDALDFLYRLTSFPKIMAVKDIQMAPTGPTTVLTSPQLSIKMNVTAFIFKVGDKPAGTTGSAPATSSTKSEGRTGNEAG